MARKPDEFAVHLILEGGASEQVTFPTLTEFQNWYKNVLVPKQDSSEFVNVPIKNLQGEYMVVRPSSIIAIRVEPIYLSSVDRDF